LLGVLSVSVPLRRLEPSFLEPCDLREANGPMPESRDQSAVPVGVARRVPGVGLARRYRRAWLRGDLIAGIVLVTLLVPQGMAYAELAGLPPVTGLYTTVLALTAYAVFGPSRILVLGPDSALGPLIAAAILPLLGANGDPTKAVALAGMLALLIGALCIVAGFARLGILAELLSKPVRTGFLNGIALVILVSQLPRLFGFGTSAQGLFDETRAFFDGVRDGRTVPAALSVGFASLAVIVLLRRVAPKVPGILLAVIGSAVLTSALDLTSHGVIIVGPIPSGFPSPRLPDVSWHDVASLVVAAVGMAFVILADTATLGRTLALRRREPSDTDQEIIALGTANLAAGLCQGFPVSASASRTAVAESSGSQTQLTGVIGAALVLVVLLADGSLGKYLPSATLAAIIIAAALNLFDITSVQWLWRVRRSDFFLTLAAFLGVAVLGVLEGIAVAIALSLGEFVRRAWRPYDAVLGRIPGRKGYHDIDRHPEAAQIPGLVLYRFDAPLFFANVELFVNRLLAAIDTRDDPISWVIVAAEPMTDIDTTAAEILREALDDFRAEGIELAFAELKGPVKDRLRSYDLYERIGDNRFFPTLGTAIDGYLLATGTPWIDWSDRNSDDDTQL
jgi:high affinity sulfate transporter 1